MHIRQPPVDPVVAERQPRVIHAEQVQSSHIDVAAVDRLLYRRGSSSTLRSMAATRARQRAAEGRPRR